MADIWYKSGQFVTPASGTTVIDVTDKGTMPFAIHLWYSRVTADDVRQGHQHFGHVDDVLPVQFRHPRRSLFG